MGCVRRRGFLSGVHAGVCARVPEPPCAAAGELCACLLLLFSLVVCEEDAVLYQSANLVMRSTSNRMKCSCSLLSTCSCGALRGMLCAMRSVRRGEAAIKRPSACVRSHHCPAQASAHGRRVAHTAVGPQPALQQQAYATA